MTPTHILDRLSRPEKLKSVGGQTKIPGPEKLKSVGGQTKIPIYKTDLLAFQQEFCFEQRCFAHAFSGTFSWKKRSCFVPCHALKVVLADPEIISSLSGTTSFRQKNSFMFSLFLMLSFLEHEVQFKFAVALNV